MIIFPFATDRPQRRFPWMNALIIAANIIIFLGVQSAGKAPGIMNYGGRVPQAWESFMLDPANPSLVQFISYQFLHAGWGHIVFNMLFLYVFGNNLNEKMGHIPYLAFYLAGGVFAGLGHALTSAAPTLGASGSISAVTGLFLVLLPRTHIKVFVWLYIFADVWEIPSLWFILFKVAQDIFEQAAGGTGVAYMAHLSGSVSGIFIGLLLLATRLVQRDHYDLLGMLNRYRRRYEYRTVVSKGYDPFNPTSTVHTGTTRNDLPDPVVQRIASLRAEITRLLKLHDLPDAAKRYLELRSVDPTAILNAQEQVDIGNQLMAESQHAPAAAAYEDYLRIYPAGGAGQQEQIALMLALTYSRYLKNPTRAIEILQSLLPRLHNASEKDLAQSELQQLLAKSP